MSAREARRGGPESRSATGAAKAGFRGARGRGRGRGRARARCAGVARVGAHVREPAALQHLLPRAQIEQRRAATEGVVVVPEALGEAPGEDVPAPRPHGLHDPERAPGREQRAEVTERRSHVARGVHHVEGHHHVEARRVVALRARILGGVEDGEAHAPVEPAARRLGAGVVDERLAQIGEAIVDVVAFERLDERPRQEPLPAADLEDAQRAGRRRRRDPAHRLADQREVDGVAPVRDRVPLHPRDQLGAAPGVEHGDGLDAPREGAGVALGTVIDEIAEPPEARASAPRGPRGSPPAAGARRRPVKRRAAPSTRRMPSSARMARNASKSRASLGTMPSRAASACRVVTPSPDRPSTSTPRARR